MNHAIDLLIFAILTLAGLALDVIGYLDSIIAGILSTAHVPPGAQFVLLAAVAILLIIFALRLLGRVFAALIIVLLLLILARQAFPKFEIPQSHLPPALHLPVTGNQSI